MEDPGFLAALDFAAKEEIGDFRPPAEARNRLPVVRFDGGLPGAQFVAVFRFAGGIPSGDELLGRVARVLDLPVLYRSTRALRAADENNRAFAHTFDLLTLLDRQDHFVPAAMTICNEVARQAGCTRASLGWRKDGYIRARAISDLPRFERNMDAVRLIEAAMEEACDQDEEIVVPEPDDAGYVARDHEQFARTQGVPYLLTLPLRLDQPFGGAQGTPFGGAQGRPFGGAQGTQTAGAVLLERKDRPFSAIEVTALRVVLDRVSRRLGELERTEGNVFLRGARATRAQLARLLGPEHTWWKALGVLGAILLLVSVFTTWPYRVQGNFVVRSDTLVNLPAPFEGYISAVPVRVGDQVAAGDILVRLDKRELTLEAASLQAELAKYEAERSQAEVERRLADMRSAAAGKDQTQASLDIVRFRLSRADIAAPAAGVVIEGDLRERIGTPVHAGDLLMRMTQIEAMYLEIEVPERDAHAVLASRKGEVAFATLPGKRYAVAIDRLEPVARVKTEGNIFVLRAQLAAARGEETWWRPGMSGVAKIDAGDRRIIWLLTHRLVDFIRMKLWL